MTVSGVRPHVQSPDRGREIATLLMTAERAEAAVASLGAQLTELRERVVELVTETSAGPHAMEAPPMLLTIDETARTLRMGRSVVWQLVRAGTLGSVKIGASRRIPVDAIVEYTNSLRAS